MRSLQSTAPVYARFTHPIAQLLQDPLFRNIGWYGIAEIVSRLSRLLATVILARMLVAEDMGIGAVAITCFELVRVLTNTGVAQLVMRAPAGRLDAACNTGHIVSAAVCLTLTVLQFAIVGAVWAASGALQLPLMIAALALVYPLMIPGLVPVFLIMREGRANDIARVSMLQVLADNALTAALAIAGAGAWAIVLPKLLTAPIWLYGVLKYQRWSPKPDAGTYPPREVMSYAAPILGSEILSAVRIHLDKLIVWMLLGLEALGVYYFAFNAGIGLSLSLTTALSASLYPELARHAENPADMLQRYDYALRRTALPIAVVIALQAACTFLYVPLVFGNRWETSAILVGILCLSAVGRPMLDASVQLLRAAGMTRAEFAISLSLTIVSLSALAIGLQFGLVAGIAALAAVSLPSNIAIAVWARRHVAAKFRRLDAPLTPEFLDIAAETTR